MVLSLNRGGKNGQKMDRKWREMDKNDRHGQKWTKIEKIDIIDKNGKKWKEKDPKRTRKMVSNDHC
jgi:hypothetical protein